MPQEDSLGIPGTGGRFSISKDLIREMFAGWCPFPTEAYCKQMGWEINPDGTVEAPGGRSPTRELCEVGELAQLYEVSDLEHLYTL